MIHKQNGITFIEVMITLAIFSVMIASLYSTAIVSQRSWGAYAQTVAPKENLRQAMAAICMELRDAENPFIENFEHGTRMQFTRPSIGKVVYFYSNDGSNKGKIIRQALSKEKVLAHNIKALAFKSAFANEIDVLISSGTSPEYSLRERIALRSKTGLFAQSENDKIN